jgi:S1-C subfamily serine protease
MGSLPTHSKPSKSIPMRKLTATLCLTLFVLLGSEVRGSDLLECDPLIEEYYFYQKLISEYGNYSDQFSYSPLNLIRKTRQKLMLLKCNMPDSKNATEYENEKLRKEIAPHNFGLKKNKLPKCDGSPLKFIHDQPESTNKQMWCGKLLCPQNSLVKNWDNCIGDYTTQNRTRYVGLWREGKTTKKGKFIFKNNKIELSNSGYPLKNSKNTTKKENERLRKRIAELEKQNQSQPKQVAKRPSPKKSPLPKSGSTGSGFFVSKLGHILTNEHVVRQCGSVTVGDNANKQVTASVLEKDKRNDLALLRISSTQMASAETLSLISKLGAQKLGLKLVPLASGGLMRSDDIELGESVMVAGYPYGELYSNTIKVTGGMVSAVKGMGDDSAQFQMDAAVQPGNSGGPIYDENGNIVGVVISQLNKLKVAKAIGSLPENVNFGIKASTVRQFLTSAGLPTKWSNRTERKSTKELAQIAKNQTVMVVCNP